MDTIKRAKNGERSEREKKLIETTSYELQKVAEKAVLRFEAYQHKELQKMRLTLQHFESASKTMLRKELDGKARVSKHKTIFIRIHA